MLGVSESQQTNFLTTSVSQIRKLLPWTKESLLSVKSEEGVLREDAGVPLAIISWSLKIVSLQEETVYLRLGLLECNSLGLAPGQWHHSAGCCAWIPAPLLRQCLWELKLENLCLSPQCKPGATLEEAKLS